MIADKRIPSGIRSPSETIHRMRTVADMIAALDIAIAEDAGCSVRGSKSFTGTESAREYRDMLTNGWSAGVEGTEGLDGLSTDRAERIQFTRAPGGAFPIVPAFLSGAPDAMLMPRPAPVDNVRGLTLVINSSFNCKITPDTCLTYAKAVMRLVAWLQAEGIETSIYSVIGMAHEGVRMLYTTPIREAGDILQPERIAAIVHPSFLRRAWFALVEHEYHELSLPGTGICKGNYGYPQEATAEELRASLPDAYSVILLPPVGAHNPDKAIRDAVSLKLKLED